MEQRTPRYSRIIPLECNLLRSKPVLRIRTHQSPFCFRLQHSRISYFVFANHVQLILGFDRGLLVSRVSSGLAFDIEWLSWVRNLLSLTTVCASSTELMGRENSLLTICPFVIGNE
jgi:hypothetical protein